MKAGVSLGATGFALIAVCYGFARFAFGLFLPRINADLSLSSTLGGLIAGGAFLAYCVAIVLAAHLTERLGPRRVAVAAALVAGAGMTGIALAPSGLWLAPAVMLAGSSTGLSSPPLAAAVSRVVAPARQAVTNTVINAGTSAGVILSGPAALLAGADWRLAFGLFAATALVLALAVVFSVPGRPGKASASADPRSLYRRLPVRLVGAGWTTPALTLAGGALFGAAYITLTGIYLVWGVRVLPDRPASGLMVGFLTVAIGQTAGAPVFGFLMDRFPALLPVTLFAGVTVLGLFARAGKDMPGAADADARGTGLAEPQPPR